MNASPTPPKVTRSVALSKPVADATARAAKEQNRSFSNYVETIMTDLFRRKEKKGATK